MHDHARGGNDQLTGGDWHSYQRASIGDACTMDGDGRGGDDTLIGGGGCVPTLLYGDATRCTTTPAAATTR